MNLNLNLSLAMLGLYLKHKVDCNIAALVFQNDRGWRGLCIARR